MLFDSINFSLEKDSVVFSVFVNYNIMLCIEFSSLRLKCDIGGIFSREEKMLGFSQLSKPIKWQNLLEKGKNCGNAFRTGAKIHFSEKNILG